MVHGRTNREIAKTLVVSVRTGAPHAEDIRNQLGLRTRAEIAAWVIDPEFAGGRP